MTPAEIKSHRESLGMTQPQFAEALGVKPRTVWGLENQAEEIPRLYALAVAQLTASTPAPAQTPDARSLP